MAQRCVQRLARRATLEVGCTPRRLRSPTGLPVPPSVSPLVSLAAPLDSPALCPSPPSTLCDPTPFELDTSLGTSMVAHDLRPCVSADREHLCAVRDAGVDEDNFACLDFPRTEALVDEPLVSSQLHDFGVCPRRPLRGWLRARPPVGRVLSPAV